MTESSKKILREKAISTLKLNDMGDYFAPYKKMYPHQWLWDSCFVVIGLAPHNPERAKQELISLLKHQWHNGMIPHMVFGEHSSGASKKAEMEWQANRHPAAPHDVKTSAITQPPLIAEAVHAVAKYLDATERRDFLNFAVPKLVAYHSWLYRARDPKEEGIVFLVHPWEGGADGSPVWRDFIDARTYSDFWLRLMKKAGILNRIVDGVRNDKDLLEKGQRTDTVQAIQQYLLLLKLRKLNYQSVKIHKHYKFKLEDVHFNSILVRANWVLKQLAHEVNADIPAWLRERFEKSVHALELMYDEEDKTYYSRSWDSHEFVKTRTFYEYMPLYAGTVSKARAKEIVDNLKQNQLLGANYQVPTVPINSINFKENKYWEGPVWPMINWFIYNGLKRYGFSTEAESIKQQTLSLVENGGFGEYFNTFNGASLGVKNFSATAGVTLSLLSD
ncbi:MAG: trehalase family glycosidase [Candidatus Saccharimonadales bacterium]|jgi:glycogen debranching enzyme